MLYFLGRYEYFSDFWFIIYTLLLFLALMSFGSFFNPDFWVVPLYMDTPLEILIANGEEKREHYFALCRYWEFYIKESIWWHNEYMHYYNGGVIGSSYVYQLSFWMCIYRLLIGLGVPLPALHEFLHHNYHFYVMYFFSNTIFNFIGFFISDLHMIEYRGYMPVVRTFVFIALEDWKINEDIYQAKFNYMVEGGNGVFFLERHTLSSISFDKFLNKSPEFYFEDKT
jgi:hypothetical protein